MAKTHYKTLIENEYLGQWDLVDAQGKDLEPIVTIESVDRFKPKFERRDEANKRLKIKFVGKQKAWLAGPTTQATIKSMYGPYIEDWIGKKIALYVDHGVVMSRLKVGGIRVRPTPPSGPPTTSPLNNPVNPVVREAQDKAFSRETSEVSK